MSRSNFLIRRTLGSLPWLAAVLALTSGQARSQSLELPAAAQSAPIVIENARIVPVSAAVIERGAIRFDQGRITALGAEVDLSGAERIDVGGATIYPGLIAAATPLGLVEIDAVRATLDKAETGLLNPNVRAEVAVNPDSLQIPVARANGVLVAQVTPQAGGIIAGRSAVLALDGWTIEHMTLAAPAALHLYWPSTRLPPWLPAPMREAALTDAKTRIDALEEAFTAAKAFARRRDDSDIDLRLAALEPVLSGELPVHLHADDYQQIGNGLDFLARHGVKRVVLVGAADAWRLTDRLRASAVDVLITGLHRLPLRRDDPVDAIYTLPATLRAAGVRFAVASSGDSAMDRNLPYQAAAALGYGLSEADALAAITLWPAQILGVDDRVGSLEAGKAATLIVVRGDILDARATVERAYIDGRAVSLDNHQTRLYRKYRQKYEARP